MVRKHTSIWIRPELYQQIDTLAQFMDKTKSQTIEFILERGLSILAFQHLLMKLKKDLKSRWEADSEKLPTFKIFNTDLIIKRDNETCQKCGSKQDLVVYHINQNVKDFSISNLITLCKSCSQKASIYIASEFINESFVVWFYLIKN